MRSWSDFDAFEHIIDKYMPSTGEGNTLASQAVTAINKLVYKWYNDGDVYDNTHCGLTGWANDLSSYANWLYYNIDEASVLTNIYDIRYDDGDAYEELLYKLCENVLTEEVLEKYSKEKKSGSIYECDGPFEFGYEEDEEDDWYDDEEEEY